MKSSLSLSKEKIKILLMENIHPQAGIVLNQAGYKNIDTIQSALSPSDLSRKIQSSHMIGIRSKTNIDRYILEKANKLIAIGCFCIGTDQVDLSCAARLGIPVFNAPHSNTRSVAELIIGLAIMLMRGIFPKSSAAHKNKWIKSASGSNELRGKTMGIVGYGHIGSQVSILAESFGMRVLYYDIRTKLPLGNATQIETLDELIKDSDVVTLHVPEDKSTINMINKDIMSKCNTDTCLINASRGKVVEIDSLAEFLSKGKLRGAAVDVFPNEPGSEDERFESPLIGIENVILTPHIGGSTGEAQKNIGIEVAAKLAGFSDLGNTEGAVNFPNVNLRPNEHSTRFLHIHENRPGLLKSVNETLANRNINVSGQYLETTNDIGYVVLDIEPLSSRQESVKLRQALQDIPGTIRTRILY